jgi:hypothetical protein
MTEPSPSPSARTARWKTVSSSARPTHCGGRFLPTNLSAPEIARQLFVSVHTVRAHQQHLYRKLGAHRRSEAVERARALGLLARAVS